MKLVIVNNVEISDFITHQFHLKTIRLGQGSGHYYVDEVKENLLVELRGDYEKTIIELTKFLTQNQHFVEKVLFLGVGDLLKNQELLENELYQVRTIYKFNGIEMNYSSLSLDNSKKIFSPIDIVTVAGGRKESSKEYLSNFAPIADNLLYGVASTIKNFEKEMTAFFTKGANYLALCKGIEEILFDEDFQKFESHLPEGFYGTYAQKKIFEKLRNSYNLKFGRDIPNEFFVEIREKISKPKLRTEEIIKKLNLVIFPFEGQFYAQLDSLLKDYKKDQIQFTFTKDYEDSYFEIKKMIKSRKDLDDFNERIKGLPYEQIVSLLEGDLDEV